MGMDALVFTLGILLIFIGFIVITLSLILSWGREYEGERKVSGGGVIIIGPIPIVFGSDRKMVLLAATLGIILMIIALTIFLVFNGYIKLHGV